MKKLNIHLVSESSGQAVKHVADSVIAKFSDIEFTKYHWPMTRNEQLLEEVFDKIKVKSGIVIYTISNDNLRQKLKQFCFEQKIPSVSPVSQVISKISEYMGVGADNFLGYNERFDDSYFEKVEAIEFALRHDDGQVLEDIEKADIVLIGASRTSKTPTSVYLAYNGFKTANVPLIYDMPFPEIVLKLKNPVVFGLVINPSRLIEIRQSRMNLLQINDHSNYTDLNVVYQECQQIKRICTERNWHIIDVSRRSIEETAAIIMRKFYEVRRARR